MTFDSCQGDQVEWINVAKYRPEAVDRE